MVLSAMITLLAVQVTTRYLANLATTRFRVMAQLRPRWPLEVTEPSTELLFLPDMLVPRAIRLDRTIQLVRSRLLQPPKWMAAAMAMTISKVAGAVM